MYHSKKPPISIAGIAACVVFMAVFLLLVNQSASACDVAVISAKASVDGRPIIWKNFDCSSYWQTQVIRLASINPTAGDSYFVYHNDDYMTVLNGSPFTPQAGTNAAGFAIACAEVPESLTPAHESMDLNTDLIQKAAQNCATLSDFESLLKTWPYSHLGCAISGNFVAIDAHGGAALYECYTGDKITTNLMPITYTKYDANTGEIVDSDGNVIQEAKSNWCGWWNRTNYNKYVTYFEGAERYLKGYDILSNLAANNELSPEYVMKTLSKDVTGIQYASSSSDTNYSTTYCISRNATRSGAVIEGVASGDDPRLTTMWSALGEPSLSVYVPTIVGAGAVGDYACKDTVASDGTMSDTSDTCLLNIAEDARETAGNLVYSSNRGNIVNGMDDKTINKVELSRVQAWTFPIEATVLAKTNQLLANCRQDPSLISTSVLKPFVNYCSKYIYENYAAASATAEAWDYTIPPPTDTIAPTATISYSTTSTTDQDVVATLLPSETVTVTNNDGSPTYTFTQNGSFTFQFRDAAGNTGTATATVTWIDKNEVPVPTYTVSISASPATAGTVSGGGNYNENASVTVTATANSGYSFINWTEGGTQVSTDKAYNFTMDTADRTLIANFTANPVSEAVCSGLSVSAPGNSTAGTSFNFTVTAQDSSNNITSGYTGTVHFISTDASSTLPSDYTFNDSDNSTHTFSAILNTPGNQTVTATDTATSSLYGTSSSISVLLAPVVPSITTTQLANGAVGTAYLQTLAATGDTPITWTINRRELPTGLSLANGRISGTPSEAGTFAFTVQAINATGSDTKDLSITIIAAPVAPSITTKTLAGGTVGTAYSQTLAATGDTPITWTISSGNLPTGLSLSNETISGTPSEAGTFAFTVQATNATGIDTRDLSITIAKAPVSEISLSVSAPGSATAGTSFNFTVTVQDSMGNTATGYTGTVHFTSTDTSATLPADCTLVAGTGTFASTLYTLGSQTITAIDTAASTICGTSGIISVSSAPVAPNITTTTLPGGTVGTPYYQTLAATGDTPITWTISSGNLPIGLSLANGAICGTPSAAGKFTFTVQATNTAGNDTQTLIIVIAAVPVSPTGILLNKSTLTLVAGGSAYTLTATVTPTNATNQNVTWVSSNTDVAAVNGGVVTPLSAGTANITATAVDGGKTSTCAVTVTQAVTAAQDTPLTINTTPMTITVPQSVSNATIYVTPGNTLPLVEINASTTLGTVQMTIPDGTTVSGPADWSGKITLPTVKSEPSATVSGAQSVNAVVEVGFGSETITLSKAVRLLIPGMAGKSVGYTRNGVFSAITGTVSADDQDTANAEITSNGEGKKDVGNDLVIWTKHFTEFVVYTPLASSSGGGGGGVVSIPQYVISTTGSASVYPTAGGKVGLDSDAVVEIPANALNGTSSVTVKVQKVDSPRLIPEGFSLGSSIFEFTVDDQTSYSFHKPVTITLKLNTTADEITAIYCYDSKAAKWIKIGGTISGSNLTISVDHFTKYAILTEKKAAAKTEPQTQTIQVVSGFIDLQTHWAKDTIKVLADIGVIGGYPDKTFKPEKTMNRTEFIVVLAKAFNLKPDNSYVLNFKDAKTIPAWGKGYVAAAAKADIIPSVWGHIFSSNTIVNRADMAYMVGKALKAKIVSKPKLTYKDRVPAWASAYVAFTYNKGIISGYNDKTFRAAKLATRAEACTIIVNAIRNRAE